MSKNRLFSFNILSRKQDFQLFKEELLALRKEKQDSAQIIRELQAQLAAQRVQFDRTLADFKESIQSN